MPFWGLFLRLLKALEAFLAFTGFTADKNLSLMNAFSSAAHIEASRGTLSHFACWESSRVRLGKGECRVGRLGTHFHNLFHLGGAAGKIVADLATPESGISLVIRRLQRND